MLSNMTMNFLLQGFDVVWWEKLLGKRLTGMCASVLGKLGRINVLVLCLAIPEQIKLVTLELGLTEKRVN